MRPTRRSSPPTERLDSHARILSGNISFGANNTDQSRNILGAWVNAVTTPATPDTEFAVPYSIQQSPYAITAQYFDVKSSNKACSVYKSTTPWTATTAYLKCNVASVLLDLFLH